MTAAREVLDRLTEIGATVKPAGDRLVVRAGPQPVPGELVQRLREAKAEILAALAPDGRTTGAAEAFCRCDPGEAAWWRRHFIIRAIDCGVGVARSRAEAKRLAWAELQNRWHRLHGERVPRDLCAGCRRLLGGAEALDLIDGNRVHIADGYDCLIRHGERWRGMATAALLSMGLAQPAESE